MPKCELGRSTTGFVFQIEGFKVLGKLFCQFKNVIVGVYSVTSKVTFVGGALIEKIEFILKLSLDSGSLIFLFS